MLGYLIALFTIIPIIELALLIKVGTHIGVMNTITLVLVTGVLGAFLARSQGFKVLNDMQNDLNRGLMPADSLFDAVMILAGGILLLTPGFITDTFGFLLLMPISRIFIKRWVKQRVTTMIRKGNVRTSFYYYE